MTLGGTPSPQGAPPPEGISARISYRSGVFVGHVFLGLVRPVAGPARFLRVLGRFGPF